MDFSSSDLMSGTLKCIFSGFLELMNSFSTSLTFAKYKFVSSIINSVCRLTNRVRHYLNSVYLAIKRQSTKSIYINDLMAKTHAYLGFNGWHILSYLVLF